MPTALALLGCVAAVFPVGRSEGTCENNHNGQLVPSLLQHHRALQVAEQTQLAPLEQPRDQPDAPSMFVAVLSRRKSFAQRAPVRKGWTTAWSSVVAKFVICDTPHDNEPENVSLGLEKETEQYGDLLFVNCSDSYKTLTSKVLQILLVYQRFYSNQSVFFKTDDDTFVSWKRMRTYLAQRWLPAIGRTMYAGVTIRDSISGRSPIRDPCCAWYQSYEDYPNETWPRSFQGGTGYLLGRDVVDSMLRSHLLRDGNPLLQPEDRQIAVWIEEARLRGDNVAYLRVPGFAGFTPRDFWRHCSILNFTEVQWVTELEEEAHRGHWKNKSHILLHKISAPTMSCLLEIDAGDRETDLLDDCFVRADKGATNSSEHDAKDLYAKEAYRPDNSGKRIEQDYQGCECNLCGDGVQQWVIVLSSGSRTGSTTIVSMLNSIPGVYITGEHQAIIDDLLSIHQKTFSHGIANDPPKNYHALISEHKLLCAMQSSVRAAMGGSLEQYAVVGFKETSYTDESQLNFILKLFPCARFIISNRRDVGAQVASQRALWLSNADEDVSARKANLESWARKDLLKNLSFDLQLEDFSLDRFNSLLRWIGVNGCNFSQVAHESHGYSLSKSIVKVPINGTCTLDDRLQGNT
jgi:hypothetical protein